MIWWQIRGLFCLKKEELTSQLWTRIHKKKEDTKVPRKKEILGINKTSSTKKWIILKVNNKIDVKKEDNQKVKPLQKRGFTLPQTARSHKTKRQENTLGDGKNQSKVSRKTFQSRR